MMRVERNGEWLTVTRITGPSHNLLSLKLEHGGPARRAPTIEVLDADSRRTGLAETEVLEAVQAGVSAANRKFGTRLRVKGIRFLRGDSRPLSVYHQLAERLVAAAAEGSSAASPWRATG